MVESRTANRYGSGRDAYCATVLRNVAESRATHSIIETGDGRSVEIVNQPLKNGGWVVTQEDITERRRAEKHRDLG